MSNRGVDFGKVLALRTSPAPITTAYTEDTVTHNGNTALHPLTHKGETPLDGAAFRTAAERITNNRLTDQWMSLYHPDAVAEWIVDGAAEHHDGMDEIRRAVDAMMHVWRRNDLQVRKELLCTSADTVVLGFEGTFRGRGHVEGTEVWTFQDNRVIHHRMHAYLDIRPRESLLAQARVVAASPRVALSALRGDHRPRTHARPSTVVRTLAMGRLGLAAVSLTMPTRFARWVGIDKSPELTYMTRVYGVRALVMGIGYLTGDTTERSRWKRLGLLVDATDTINGLEHLARRDVPVRSALSMLALTGSYAVLEAIDIHHEQR